MSTGNTGRGCARSTPSLSVFLCKLSKSEAARISSLRHFPTRYRLLRNLTQSSLIETVILCDLNASSMAFKLHFPPADERSNSTIAISRPDSNHMARLVGAYVRAISHCECRRRATRPAIKRSTEPDSEEIETTGEDFISLGNFGSQRASQSARLLGQPGREGK